VHEKKADTLADYNSRVLPAVRVLLRLFYESTAILFHENIQGELTGAFYIIRFDERGVYQPGCDKGKRDRKKCPHYNKDDEDKINRAMKYKKNAAATAKKQKK